MSITIKLDTAKLDKLAAGLRPKAEQVLDVAARHIERGWKSYIVAKHIIDTGAYLGSVHVQPEHEPLQRVIADAVEYGALQEFGGHGRPPRTAAGPAVEDERKPLTDAFKALFQ